MFTTYWPTKYKRVLGLDNYKSYPLFVAEWGRSRIVRVRKEDKGKEKGERSVMRFFRDSTEERSGERIGLIGMDEVV